MRARGVVLTMVAMLAMGTASGCDRPRAVAWLAARLPGARTRSEPVLTWTTVDPAALVVNNDPVLHAVRFSLHLPELVPAPGLPGMSPKLAAIELGFLDRLDGAKVDASAAGPRQSLRIIEGKRIAGDTVVVPLAPLPSPCTDVELVIHNHLRPAPMLRQIRIGRTPGAPGARP